MNFKVKRIKKQSKVDVFRQFTQSPKGKWTLSIVGLFAVAIVFGKQIGTSSFIEHGALSIVRSFDISSDSNGRTNLLLLGVAGDSEEGGNLTDSIMIVSIDSKNYTAGALSVPRDLFVERDTSYYKVNRIYPDARNKALRSVMKKNDKNHVTLLNNDEVREASEMALQETKEIIGHQLGVEIHHGAIIRFSLFEELIDTLGGISIDVPAAIYDTKYPADNYQYQTFSISAGPQTLDGAKALKYARSRQTTSDFDRAQRQQLIMQAIKDQVVSSRTITQIKDFYEIYKDYVVSDLSLTTVARLAEVGADSRFEFSEDTRGVLTDLPFNYQGLPDYSAPLHKGQILIVGDKSVYGQFALAPESQEKIRLFAALLLSDSSPIMEKAKIQVLNGSQTEGLAREAANELIQMGLEEPSVGNFAASNPPKYMRIEVLTDKTPETIKFLMKLYPMASIKKVKNDTSGNDINIILGNKFYETPKYEQIKALNGGAQNTVLDTSIKLLPQS